MFKQLYILFFFVFNFKICFNIRTTKINSELFAKIKLYNNLDMDAILLLFTLMIQATFCSRTELFWSMWTRRKTHGGWNFRNICEFMTISFSLWQRYSSIKLPTLFWTRYHTYFDRFYLIQTRIFVFHFPFSFLFFFFK